MAEGVGKQIVYKKMQCRYNQNKKGQDTMKYSIAICDDARKDRELLRGFLGRWAGDRGFVSHNELWQAQAQYYAG